ncbi:MAG: pseudouridine synthase [Saprospiraceae bacterium]|nr:pseudouridine synthase [Saprospiraceae bacterium]
MCEHHHYKIHKPFGYLSQFVNNQDKRRNKKLLGELGAFPDGIMAIGRLDEDSEGLLLLTTDGKVSEQVRSKKIEKEYYVQVDGDVTDEAIKSLEEGVEIGIRGTKYMTLPCAVRKLDPAPNFKALAKKIRDDRHGPTSWLSIVIGEGKYRQVRKMTAAAGFPTLRLLRVRIGHLHLSDLQAGEVTEVDDFEIETSETEVIS